MAERTLSPPPQTLHLGRRGALTLLAGGASAAGIVAGAAASALPGPHPDAGLLALRRGFDLVLAEFNATEVTSTLPPGKPDKDYTEWLDRIGREFEASCRAIVEMPPAQTAEGRALKAAATMHQLRFAYSGGGHWPGAGEDMAWNFLSELAGDAYVPPAVPDYLTSKDVEPDRRAWA